MNFVDYCIETRNYSALSALNEYTKSFGKTNLDITDEDLRENLAGRLNNLRKVRAFVADNYRKGLGSEKAIKDTDKMIDLHKDILRGQQALRDRGRKKVW